MNEMTRMMMTSVSDFPVAGPKFRAKRVESQAAIRRKDATTPQTAEWQLKYQTDFR